MTPDGHRPFTPAWAEAFRAAINASPHYREVAKHWRWAVALVLEAEPARGYPHDVVLRLDLDRGTCHTAGITEAVPPETPFTLRGGWQAWHDIVTGTLDPVQAILRRRLHLEGALATLMMHMAAARALVDCAQDVPTDFGPGPQRPA